MSCRGCTGTDGDLIADRPNGPGQNPEVLVFSRLARPIWTRTRRNGNRSWHLAKLTGKVVTGSPRRRCLRSTRPARRAEALVAASPFRTCAGLP